MPSDEEIDRALGSLRGRADLQRLFGAGLGWVAGDGLPVVAMVPGTDFAVLYCALPTADLRPADERAAVNALLGRHPHGLYACSNADGDCWHLIWPEYPQRHPSRWVLHRLALHGAWAADALSLLGRLTAGAPTVAAVERVCRAVFDPADLAAQFAAECAPPDDEAFRAGRCGRFPLVAREHTPYDQTVAVDAEVLARPVELGPGREAAGRYYTPKLVATFMCREALKAWLSGPFGVEPARRLVDDRDPSGVPAKPVLTALRGLRVCDPACGSGAFLVAMMQELVDLRQLLGDGADVAAQVVGECLSGTDLDAAAVAVAQRRLRLAAGVTAPLGTGDGLMGGPPPAPFDVVVGNPPYVRHERLDSAYKARLRQAYPEVDTGSADLYVYFLALAQRLLKADGVGCLITANRWLRAAYAAKLRALLAQRSACRLVVDFGEAPVFDDATVATAVVLWQQRPPDGTPTRRVNVRDWPACLVDGLTDHVAALRSASPRPARRPTVGVPLSEYAAGRLFRGVVTGCNDAFVLDGPGRQRLLAQDPAAEQWLCPVLRGDDVRRYETHFRERYLLRCPQGWDQSGAEVVLRHLAPFRARLTPKAAAAEPGPGRKPGRYAWCEWQDAVAYLDSFAAPKLLYPDISRTCRFVLDDTGCLGLNTTYLIAGADWYLLGVLNSAAVQDHLRESCSVLGDAHHGGRLRFFSVHLNRVPVPEAGERDRRDVADLAQQAQALCGQRRRQIEAWFAVAGGATAQSHSRNALEEPWRLTLDECVHLARRQRLNGAPAQLARLRDETAALTASAEAVSGELDQRVAALYGR